MSDERRKLYLIWGAMKQRCGNPKSPNYKHYGARGIRVCQRWIDDFDAFVRDMGPRPEGRSIDRINNDGNYEPGNTRWATTVEQLRNRRPQKENLIEFNGKSQNASAWERELGFSKSVLRSRILAGWPLEKAMTTPVRPCRRSSPHQSGFRSGMSEMVGSGGSP
jgi:hypothetical protein